MNIIKKQSTKPIVTVDSDTLIFKAASVVDNRSVLITHQPTGIAKGFKNRTEFRGYMQDKQKEITDSYIIKDIQEPEPVENALSIIKRGAEEILDNFIHCEVIFCAGADNNFRDNLPYPSKYKGNRTDMIKPVLLGDCYKYFYKKYKAVRASQEEVDDTISWLAYEALSKGREAIILSPDADSRQFDGVKLGNYDSLPQDCELLKFFPDSTWDEKKKQFYSTGFPWMISQLCIGDKSDNLCPYEVAGVRYGEKTFYKAVKDFTKPEEYVHYAMDLFQKWYPEDFEYTSWDGQVTKANWQFMLQLYWKGTTMKRQKDELPDFWKFLKERGID